jgi:hypothetical protein
VLFILPVATLLQAVVFYGSPRFRLQAEPILVILAAAGIVWVLGHVFGERFPSLNERTQV